jgi:hypothetical protein
LESDNELGRFIKIKNRMDLKKITHTKSGYPVKDLRRAYGFIKGLALVKGKWLTATWYLNGMHGQQPDELDLLIGPYALISKDKAYGTRDEKYEIIIYTTEGGGTFPVHGALRLKGAKDWTAHAWTEDGRQNQHPSFSSNLDLIEIPEIIKVWVEYYLNIDGSFHVSKYLSEEAYLTNKAGGELHPELTHLRVDQFKYLKPDPK